MTCRKFPKGFTSSNNRSSIFRIISFEKEIIKWFSHGNIDLAVEIWIYSSWCILGLILYGNGVYSQEWKRSIKQITILKNKHTNIIEHTNFNSLQFYWLKKIKKKTVLSGFCLEKIRVQFIFLSTATTTTTVRYWIYGLHFFVIRFFFSSSSMSLHYTELPHNIICMYIYHQTHDELIN